VLSVLSPQTTSQTRVMRAVGWAGLVCTLGVSILSFLNLRALEFGPLAHQAISVDETYFAACAARGTATGEIPISGCHDNKAPLIFLLYQLIQPTESPYDLFAIKTAAFTTVVMIAVLAGWIAFRLAGLAAAVVAPALIIQAFTGDANLLAFKTETVGAVFMLGALAILAERESWRRPWILLAAGISVGLAVVTKQTYGFAAIAVILWLAVVSTRAGGVVVWLARFAARATVFCLGTLFPFMLFLITFYGQGRHVDFLSSFFLYPAVYGVGSGYSAFRVLIWRSAAILENMSYSPSLFALFVAAAILNIRWAFRDVTAAHTRLLVLMTSLLLFVTLLGLPVYFAYHAIPAWVPMAILGSVVIGDYWPGLFGSAPKVAASLSIGLLAAALLPAAGSWLSNGGRGSITELRRAEAELRGSRGEFAYVLGTWPGFYFDNGMIPASSVQFPWALPGTPATWIFSPPDTDSFRGRLLAQLQKRNLANLYAEFRGTPPRYIAVLDKMARGPRSRRVSDVPGFDDYLRDSCNYSHSISDPRRGAVTIYRCGTP
jgi:hypothetical protein